MVDFAFLQLRATNIAEFSLHRDHPAASALPGRCAHRGQENRNALRAVALAEDGHVVLLDELLRTAEGAGRSSSACLPVRCFSAHRPSLHEAPHLDLILYVGHCDGWFCGVRG